MNAGATQNIVAQGALQVATAGVGGKRPARWVAQSKQDQIACVERFQLRCEVQQLQQSLSAARARAISEQATCEGNLGASDVRGQSQNKRRVKASVALCLPFVL